MNPLRYALPVVALLALATMRPTAAPIYSEWSAPINLGQVVNSGFNEAGPAISKDGLTLYFTSNRPGGVGSNDIWVSQRATQDSEWGAPINIGHEINSTADDGNPAFSRDEHWMFFNSTRAEEGSQGLTDIWVSYREHTKDPFGWQKPVALGPEINTAFQDVGATYFENDEGGLPQLFFASNRPGTSGPDIFVSELRRDGSFGPAALVPELNSPETDLRPSIRFDGLEMFLYSTRAGGAGMNDLWTASRTSVFEPWSTPVNLTALNSPLQDQQPNLSADRETLYFASNRTVDNFGGLDLYEARRVKIQP